MASKSPEFTISGKELCGLMRRHRVTIRELARRTGFPQTKIRQRRTTGITRTLAALDWIEAITGEFTPRMRAILNQWRANRWPAEGGENV